MPALQPARSCNQFCFINIKISLHVYPALGIIQMPLSLIFTISVNLASCFVMIGIGKRGLGAAAIPTREKCAKISHNRAEIDLKFRQNFHKQWKFYRAAPQISPPPTPIFVITTEIRQLHVTQNKRQKKKAFSPFSFMFSDIVVPIGCLHITVSSFSIYPILHLFCIIIDV